MTIPSLLYEKIKDEFLKREQRLLQEVDLTQGPEGLHQEIRTRELLQFVREERKMFVQVGSLLMTINSLRPYPGWDHFKPKIAMIFEKLS